MEGEKVLKLYILLVLGKFQYITMHGMKNVTDSICICEAQNYMKYDSFQIWGMSFFQKSQTL